MTYLLGYCVDLLMELAKIMDFEYEIVPSDRNQYGKKNPDGSWTGVVGDLISGEIDISVATLTMTTEREEVSIRHRVAISHTLVYRISV